MILGFHFVPSGSDQKVEVCKEYGADVAINYKTQDFAVEVLSATADTGISVLHMKIITCYVAMYCNLTCVSLQERILFLTLLVPPTGRNTANVSPLMAELCI